MYDESKHRRDHTGRFTSGQITAGVRGHNRLTPDELGGKEPRVVHHSAQALKTGKKMVEAGALAAGAIYMGSKARDTMPLAGHAFHAARQGAETYPAALATGAKAVSLAGLSAATGVGASRAGGEAWKQVEEYREHARRRMKQNSHHYIRRVAEATHLSDEAVRLTHDEDTAQRILRERAKAKVGKADTVMKAALEAAWKTDPVFVEITKILYGPDADLDEVAEDVFGKSGPDASDVHVQRPLKVKGKPMTVRPQDDEEDEGKARLAKALKAMLDSDDENAQQVAKRVIRHWVEVEKDWKEYDDERKAKKRPIYLEQSRLRRNTARRKAGEALAVTGTAAALVHPKVASAAARGVERVAQTFGTGGKVDRAYIQGPAAIAALATGWEAGKRTKNAAHRGKEYKVQNDAWNSKYKAIKKADTTWEGEFSKVDEDKRQVFGWASVTRVNGKPVVDLQSDFIPDDELEKGAYDYVLKSRVGGDMHTRVDADGNVIEKRDDKAFHAADLIESMVFTPEKIEKMGLPDDFPTGWWVGFKVNDEPTWQAVKNGDRKGFSIHGVGKRVEKSLDSDVVKFLHLSGEQQRMAGLGGSMGGNVGAIVGAGLGAAKGHSGMGMGLGAASGGLLGATVGITAGHHPQRPPRVRAAMVAQGHDPHGPHEQQGKPSRLRKSVGTGNRMPRGNQQEMQNQALQQATMLLAPQVATHLQQMQQQRWMQVQMEQQQMQQMAQQQSQPQPQHQQPQQQHNPYAQFANPWQGPMPSEQGPSMGSGGGVSPTGSSYGGTRNSSGMPVFAPQQT